MKKLDSMNCVKNAAFFAICLSFSGCLSASPSVSKNTSASGSQVSPTAPTNQTSQSSGTISLSISNGQASNDDTYTYYQYSYTGTPSFFRVYIDTDANAGTGYQLGSIGVEYLVENGTLYQYSGSGTDWSWRTIGSIASYSTASGVAKFTLTRSSIGTAATSGEVSDLIYDVQDSSSDLQLPLTQTYTSTSVPATTASFLPLSYDATILPNPERGWAGWVGSDFVSDFSLSSLQYASSIGERLLFCPIDLAQFRGKTAVSSAFLSALNTNFQTVRSNGMKCVVQLAYDISSGSGNDDTVPNMKGQLASLSATLKANADVIAYAKAGMIGAFGEWWGSLNGNSCGWATSIPCPDATVFANRAAIRDALMNAFDPSTQIEFRYPADMMRWYPTPLSSAGAFNGSTQSRMGFHNDCQLSSPVGSSLPNLGTDYGTFVDAENSPGFTTAQMQAYASSMTEFVSYGGETAANCSPQIVDCASAILNFSHYHQTWFKDAGADISAWTQSWAKPATGFPSGCLNQIKNLAGYRFQLDKVTHPSAVSAGTSAVVKVFLRNVGWSRLFSARHLIVRACLGSTCYKGTSTSDLRSLPSQATASTEMDVTLAIPSGAPTGNYQLQVMVPDIWSKTSSVRAYSIQFANANNGAQSWSDSGTGYMTTGTTFSVK